MSAQNDPLDTEGDDGSIIRPVGYQPKTETRDARFRLRRWQSIVIAILVPTLLAVWFLFTAKSVRLTFEPEVEAVSVSGGLSFELGGI
ncbi:MAG: hypothetical protein ACC642_08115, partial [Pseudomonadales bacterium]